MAYSRISRVSRTSIAYHGLENAISRHATGGFVWLVSVDYICRLALVDENPGPTKFNKSQLPKRARLNRR